MEELHAPGAGEAPETIAFRLDLPDSSRPGAPVILYLHGFASSQSGEKALFFRKKFLGAGLAFCSLDFRGHGESGGSLKELTLTRCLEDVALVRQELASRGHERFIVVGSSMGGLAGLWAASREPDGVDAGLYIAPALDLAERAATWFGAEGLARWEKDGEIEIETELTRTKLGWGFLEDLRRHTLERLKEGHRIPSLLLMGKKDASVSWQVVTEFATGAPFEGVELHLFADGDHRLLAFKERLWLLMVEFLRGRGVLT